MRHTAWFFLESYHPSFRKRFSQKPKFYFYDLGVSRLLSNAIDLPIQPGTSKYGEAFEHLVILEIHRLNEYLETHFRLSYCMTSSGVEVDIIIERPGKRTLLVEIKSAQKIHEHDLNSPPKIQSEMKNSEAICLYQGSETLVFADGLNRISAFQWQKGIEEIIFSSQFK